LIVTDISYEQEMVIKPYDIDASGHVNNAVYINWLEDLRNELFKRILPFDELISNGLYLVVASTTIQYKKPLFLFQNPIGRMKVDSYDKGVWLLSAVIEFENRPVARAQQKCVFIDKQTNKMIRRK